MLLIKRVKDPYFTEFSVFFQKQKFQMHNKTILQIMDQKIMTWPPTIRRSSRRNGEKNTHLINIIFIQRKGYKIQMFSGDSNRG